MFAFLNLPGHRTTMISVQSGKLTDRSFESQAGVITDGLVSFTLRDAVPQDLKLLVPGSFGLETGIICHFHPAKQAFKAQSKAGALSQMLAVDACVIVRASHWER